ncbi:MAG: Kef family K(+) transporter [Cellvibrionales bacterium]|jgi:CPA2 family monovalent cation:H+ antiporter-2|nr:Kef family K(+) transporter [Cellvibrionales bacterium]MBK8674999.1 Kef family K(+) transporter [Cellvibrionales bacterium]TXH50289.1 MAG: Kef family K(+) transporter [Cellvibrionales bacterium]HRF88241.1 YbaL family putative K(+) efflux transporter [Pseudomonadales bacterium]HRG49491.1 YbaL family putative K(+) efflux transporter [Pseudomonadales bacterium]
MPHETPLIFTIAASFALALVLGFLAARIKLPVLVGYMVAGILVGPLSPGLVVDVGLSQQLAEIGVILLMFGVGLHFSLADLFSVRRIALPGALIEIPLVTALGAGLATWWGWSLGGALVFGLCLSVASTVVLVRAMETHGQLKTMNGHIAIGWLVVEDLVMVLVLVLLPPLAGVLSGNSGAGDVHTLLKTLAMTFIKVAGFIALMMVVGRKVFPWLLWQVAHTGSRELFNLCVVAAAIGIAYGAATLFGVSIALGAFFAGIVLRESDFSYRAAQESQPLRDAFSVLFFVSVGMLFDPRVLLDNPLGVLAVLAIIMCGKSMLAFTLVKARGYPLTTALTVSVGLAQIGEFSFILAGLGVSLNLLPKEGLNLILAGSLLSIALNPLVFHAVEPLQRWIRTRSRFARFLEQPDDPLAILPMTFASEELTNHVVLVGYGRVGRRVGRALRERGLRYVVVEENRDLVEGLRAKGLPAVAGDAVEPEVLIQAHIARASLLIVAMPDAARTGRMLAIARMLNPHIGSIARVHSDDEAELLEKENVGGVFFGEQELANAMISAIDGQLSEQRHQHHG